ncbi:tRNA(Ile)-lysidine synthase [Corynebacterium mycetoides]|uniref:tRNA(Ile)-lysidine synthase n=1 Tax=Corynebacterium mycetoides TaxID=38302 RepID=A0A1G9P440_9CORY|nr:tRNA lysidine(34) synthetase TilS [Corynebacterium mycetoides]SDL93480.1 tRNA(Ile)-lysidine synthase [Corynebacterium mycetoides]
MQPFWPRRSPHFLACRRSLDAFHGPAVIGLSGGADSLALVAAAAAERKDVRAVVVDHGLQAGSAAVAERAAAQARAWGVEASVVPVEVVAEGNEGESVEARAREARYDALLSFGVDVWVAHTADDQAETLLLGALRGNPSGMPVRTARGVVRPFLKLRRADTSGACAELGVEPWQDPMNDDEAFRRVAVRKRVIPQLSELIGGDSVPALATAAHRIAADNELLESLVDVTATSDCAALAAAPGPVRRRRLAAWLHSCGVRVHGAQLGAIEGLVVRWHGQGPIDVGGGRAVRRVGAELVVVGRG